jgi:hypothetical protein
MSYVVVYVFSELTLEVMIVHVVDIGGIDDHHCLKFLFTILFEGSTVTIWIWKKNYAVFPMSIFIKHEYFINNQKK